MKKLFLTTAIAAAMAAPAAFANDFGGGYAGLRLGMVHGDSHSTTDLAGLLPTSVALADTNLGGFAGGAEIGYDHVVTDGWLIGIRGTYSIFSADDTGGSNFAFGIIDVNERVSIDDEITAGGRIGYYRDNLLLYVTLSSVWSEVSVAGNASVFGFPVASYSNSERQSGIGYGAGIEFALDKGWNIGFEWQHVDLGSTSSQIALFGTPTPASVQTDVEYDEFVFRLVKPF